MTANSDWGKILKTDDEGEKLRIGRTANRGWWEPGGHSADMKASEGGVNKSEGTGPPELDFSSNRRIASVNGQRVCWHSYREDAVFASIKVVPQAYACPCFIGQVFFYVPKPQAYTNKSALVTNGKGVMS